MESAAVGRPGADRAEQMQDQLRNLVRTHHVNLLAQIDKLGQMLAGLNADADCVRAVAGAEGLAHQIKGAGGSIGFAGVSRAATILDDHLKSLVALGGAVTAGQIEPAIALFDDLRRIARDTTPESSTLYNANLSRR
jgi:HPt (histidine-containing phosphotransfer) domain-containing protein